VPDSLDEQALTRWRLLLGRFADRSLGGNLGASGKYRQMDRALEYLYGREYAGRGVRKGGERGADLSASVLTVPDWLREVRDLFPAETVEVIEKHALDRYGLTELVTDAEVLAPPGAKLRASEGGADVSPPDGRPGAGDGPRPGAQGRR